MLVTPGTRVLIASPHRYPDLARLWHRFVLREVVPALAGIGLELEVNIFRDANASQFNHGLFPGVVFSQAGPGMRDFMEFYDAALRKKCDFVFFVDADAFFLDGEWICSYFAAFREPRVAAVSFVPRRGAAAIFALLCHADSYRALPAPVFACRYEFPEIWPNGVNLQPGEFAARELERRGKKIIIIDVAESSEHIVMFRGTTGIRATREQISQVVGDRLFQQYASQSEACMAAAYDNILIAALYERLFGEPFAADVSGDCLAGSMTMSELCRALNSIHDPEQIRRLTQVFQRSERAILKLADREGVELSLPPILPVANRTA